MDPIVQIPNGTYNLNVQVNDPNTFLLFIGTIVLAGATCFIAYFTFHYSRKSHDFIKKEFHEKMKPLLVIEKFEFREPFEEKSIEDHYSGIYIFVCSYTIRNKGLSSARNIKIRYATTNNLDIKEVIKEFPPNDRGESQATVPSNDSFDIIRTVSTEHGCNLAIWFEFDYLKDQNGQCLTILSMSKQKLPIVWYDGYDIIEAKKWNEDGMNGKRNAPL